MSSSSIFWFRRDLRLADNPALLAAADGGAEVLGVFVADDALLKPAGRARRAFLAGCLRVLSQSMDGRLLVVHGRPETTIPRLASAVSAASVHAAADFGPYGRRRDERVGEALAERGIRFHHTGSSYAVAPGRVRKSDGRPYSVFTPFYRAWTAHGWRRPAGPGSAVSWIDPQALEHRHDPEQFAAGLPQDLLLPEPGEAAASRQWRAFVEQSIQEYDVERDRPDHPGTSRMSPYLKWGCIHPRTMLADLSGKRSAGAASFRLELGFREFYADILLHQPHSLTTSVDPVIDRLPWDDGPDADERLKRWKQGLTGFPYIDAGMRQLLAEGWMHNRVRMGVASFLIKDLHLPWQVGARHFMEHLVDGDAASNTHGWQWVAGSGAQAAPYYRVFNPVGQGEKHDPDGEYVRRYVPELAGVSGKAVHRPWDLPSGTPSGYPDPIVDHDIERRETLRRWEHRQR